ncbi:helix-turn-helix transcriptional regulator [Pseudomonas sp. AN-1]|uniref:XRE family transcriptional regulator n=1 Tax=Pseudomonas sp. AN-1 TaxID=3096605 RepID=UPI002A6A8400|nr:helix-turn-helix transcriptional regulator [Pseudomonas sp. AN-1]WPP47131.1 helix-turn-helix transcriptional regulator [Pseudomonas sp. AN-1]
MNEGLAARIRQCAEIAGSGDELSRLTAIPRRTLEYYLTGEREPKVSRCVEIAKAVGADVGWLVSGEGEIRPKPAEANTALDEDRFALVPLYDVTVSAGHGLLNGEENKLADLAFTRYWIKKVGLCLSQLAAIRVKGDSMEPTIRGGDTILVDMAHTQIQDGQVFVIRDGETLLVKRLQRKLGGVIRVISDNRLYPEFEATADSLHVVGRAVWKGGLI